MKKGDVREDGMVYWARPSRGHPGGHWRSRTSYNRGRMQSSLCNAKVRSKTYGRECDLDISYLVSIFPEDMKCPVLGTQMEWGGDGRVESSPSLDRIHPDKGYVKGNVVWISWRANRLKSDATPEEIERIAAYVRGHLQQETMH